MDSNFRFLVARPSNRHGRRDYCLEKRKRICRGTEGSNSAPSSGESRANLTSHHPALAIFAGGPRVRIHLPPAASWYEPDIHSLEDGATETDRSNGPNSPLFSAVNSASSRLSTTARSNSFAWVGASARKRPWPVAGRAGHHLEAAGHEITLKAHVKQAVVHLDGAEIPVFEEIADQPARGHRVQKGATAATAI